jgi:hypothetical protein
MGMVGYLNFCSIFKKLIEWQKRQIYETIPLPVLRIHHVLAGCIDRLVAKEAPDWKTVFALLLWYPSIDASLYLKNYGRKKNIIHYETLCFLNT